MGRYDNEDFEGEKRKQKDEIKSPFFYTDELLEKELGG